MEFAFTIQCFFHRPNVFLVRQAIIAVQLPIHFFYFNFYRRLFIVIFADKAKNGKKKKAPHIGSR